MYDAKGKYPVFMESVLRLGKHRHTYIECVPVENEDAEICFWNELDKAESVWRLLWSRSLRCLSARMRNRSR